MNKLIALSLAVFAIALAPKALAAESPEAKHPAAQFVHDTLTDGQRILENKKGSERLSGMCRLLYERLGTTVIADQWLGSFASLRREALAVGRLRAMVPSIIISKVLQNIGDREVRGSFLVKDVAADKGGGRFDVEVVITTPAGKQHTGQVAVLSRSGMKIVDVLYMDMSAVDGLGSEYRQILQEEFEKDTENSMPVTALINHITAEEGYTRCL